MVVYFIHHQGHIDDLMEQLAAAHSELEKKNAELAACRAKVNTLNNKNVAHRIEVDHLKNKLTEREWSIESTETSILELDRELIMVSKMRDIEHEANERLQRNLLAERDVSKALRQYNEEARASLAKAEARIQLSEKSLETVDDGVKKLVCPIMLFAA